jgi:hypothetical protein
MVRRAGAAPGGPAGGVHILMFPLRALRG